MTLSLAKFASFLNEHHLASLTEEYMHVIRTLDVPLMRQFEHLPAEQLNAMAQIGLVKFLGDLASGEALAAATEGLRQWEADEIPGIAKDSIEPSDLVLIYAAQKDAMLAHLPHYAETVAQATGIVRELEAFFREVQDRAFQLYAKIRDESAQRESKLRVTQEFAEELQASNEELQAQAEELEAQREELQQLYERLRQHTDKVEEEVTTRSRSLSEREQQLAAAERMANIGSWEFDLLTDRVHWSDHLFRIHGYEPQAFEVTYDKVQGHTHPDDAAKIRACVERSLATGEPYSLEYRITRPDGQSVLAWTMAEVRRDAAGRPTKFVGVSMDITARRQAEEELERQATDLAEANRQLMAADRYKNEFMAVISHELRTPLNFITGFASVMLDGVGGDPAPLHQEYLGKILSGADRLLMLVNDLLDFAAMQAGTLSIRREPTELSPVASEALALVAPRARQRGVDLRAELDFKHMANVDAMRIQQVLVNLIDNGVKFTQSGGHVCLRGWNEGRQAIFEVSDNGPGIPEEQIPRIFQHFTQLDMGLTRQAGGVGLGLTIVRRLVDAHGGQVEVKSRVGEGSTFRVSLPVEGTGRLVEALGGEALG